MWKLLPGLQVQVQQVIACCILNAIPCGTTASSRVPALVEELGSKIVASEESD